METFNGRPVLKVGDLREGDHFRLAYKGTRNYRPHLGHVLVFQSQFDTGVTMNRSIMNLPLMTPAVCTKCGWGGAILECQQQYAQPTCPKCNYAVLICEVLKTEFVKELEQLINKHSMENGSNTPDFILADYMANCLRSFNNSIRARDKWTASSTTMSQAELAK